MDGGRPADMSPAPRVALLTALAVALAGVAIIARAVRGATFAGDDWAFLLGRRGFNAGVFLRPHNEHLSALPIAAYKLLLAVFGASSYVPFMALLLLVHGAACLLLYLIARRYLGSWPALIPAAILAVLGPAWQDLLWAFQVGYLGSVATGLGMVLCLEQHRRGADRAAALLLLAALLCSSIGLAMVVLGLVLVVLDRREGWRRLWVIGAPVALYLIWYAAYGVSTIHTANITRIPKYVAQALSAALSSTTGLAQTHVSPYLVSTSYGRFLAVAAVLLIVAVLVRRRHLAPLAWGSIVAALALWVAEALEYFPGGREAAQSRYQYTAAALVLLAGAAIAGGTRIGRRVGLTVAAAAVAICASNIAMLNQRSGFWRQNNEFAAAEIGALELTRGIVSPAYVPENGLTVAVIGNHNITTVRAGPYFSAVDAFGSPADSPAEILRAPEPVRQAADLILAEAERLALLPVAGRALAPSAQAGGASSGRSGCRRALTGPQLGELRLGPGEVRIRVRRGTTAVLELRRFGAGYRFVSMGNLPPPFARARLRDGITMRLVLPPDRLALPWHARVSGGRGVQICGTPVLG